MPLHLTYFVHSTTQDNEQRISSGWNDVPLSELGVQQSHALRKTLQDAHFDLVVCSDLLRAKQTAEIVFPLHPDIRYDARLRECNYGELNGHPSDIVEPLQETHITSHFPSGESYEDVRDRVIKLLEELKLSHDSQKIAFISSKAPQIALDVIVHGYLWSEAFARDWRKTQSWQPGWGYLIV